MTNPRRKMEVVPATPTMIEVIAQAVRDPMVDAQKMRQLLELHREIERDVDRRLFYSHMSRVQASISQVATDAANPATSSRYASYAALDAALRPHYTREGFSVGFDAELKDGGMLVTCTISRGAWQTQHHAPMPITTTGAKGQPVMTQIHAHGSSFSYGKRYSLAMGFNIAVAKDDDANRAGTMTVSTTQLDDMMKLAAHHDAVWMGKFFPFVSERLGYPVENLNMVLRKDIGRVTSWLKQQKGEKHGET